MAAAVGGGSLRFQLRSSSSSASPSSSSFPSENLYLRFLPKKVSTRDYGAGRSTKRVVVVSSPVKAYQVSEDVAVSVEKQLNLFSLVADAAKVALKMFKTTAVERQSWAERVELFVGTTVINCRFFALIAVAGSLIGSILCFVEGCFLVLESFFQYFHAISQRSDQGEVMHLLIEAMDMFLVGTAVLNFGMGLYIMFVGSKGVKKYNSWLIPGSGTVVQSFRKLVLFPSCFEMECISEAKAKIGHAVMMILQAGVVDKFKSVPLTTGLDLACFAGAILFSSAGLFLLSRLHNMHGRRKQLRQEEKVMTASA